MESLEGTVLPRDTAIGKVKSMRLPTHTCDMNQSFDRLFCYPRKQSFWYNHSNPLHSSCVSCQFRLGEPWIDAVEGNFRSTLRHSWSSLSDIKDYINFKTAYLCRSASYASKTKIGNTGPSALRSLLRLMVLRVFGDFRSGNLSMSGCHFQQHWWPVRYPT